MPRPTSGTTIQRPDLGAIAYEYYFAADQAGFIGQRVMPIFEVPEQSADYPVLPYEAVLKLPDTRRAPRGAYKRGDYEFETETYSCKEYGWEEPLDDVEAALYNRFFDAEQIAIMRAVNILLRSQEKRIADMCFNTGNFSAYDIAASSNEWDEASNATPRADIKHVKLLMRAATGMVPNAAIMNYVVFEHLLATNEIKTYLQYTSPHLLKGLEEQRALVAKYFGVDEVFVAGGMYDSANKGQSVSLTDVWSDDYVMLARIASGRDLREPSLGRTFLWTEDSPQNLVTEQYREEQTRSNIYRVRHHVDEEFIFTGAGYLLSNVTT